MLDFFPENYAWSNIAQAALSMGGNLAQVNAICERIRPWATTGTPEAQNDAASVYAEVADSVVAVAVRHEKAGAALTASECYLRAAAYLFSAEQFVSHRFPLKAELYDKARNAFRAGLRLSGIAHEFVEIPYGDTHLPALFVPAAGASGRAPCVVHFDGADWMKEILFLVERDDAAQRGLSVLFVDTPGVGEALRIGGLPLNIRTEEPATACVDYLLGRGDVDPERLGIMGVSFGGFMVVRAAAFEKRFKACAAFGAFWDGVSGAESESEQGTQSVPDQDVHIAWILGEDTPEAMHAKLAEITLEGVADKLECDLFVAHGGNDRQIPVWHAEKTHEAAVNARSRELYLFTPEEGGSEHASIDAMRYGAGVVFDWLAATL